MIPGLNQLLFEDGRVLEPSEALEKIELPFGDAPPGLAEEDTPIPEELEHLGIRVRTLVSNAEDNEAADPRIAAVCLHEAGRILGRRLSRGAQSWLCHSRALALDPDNGPALDALLRLARRGGDRGLLHRVLEVTAEAPSSDVGRRAIMAERVAARVAEGSWREALDTAKEASAEGCATIGIDLLRTGMAAREGDGDQLLEALAAIARRREAGQLGKAARLCAALVEERAASPEEALESLDEAADEEVDLPVLWARARLLGRAGKASEAAVALSRLASKLGDGDVALSLGRWVRAARMFDPEFAEGAEAGLAAQPPVHDLDLLEALRSEGFSSEEAASSAAAKEARDDSMASALSLGGAAARVVRGEGSEIGSLDVPLGAPWSAALSGFFGEDGRAGLDQLDVEDGDLHRALLAGLFFDRFDDLDRVLSRLADETGDEQPWDLAVARAAVRANSLGRPMEGAGILRSAQSDLSVAPLASMIRVHDRSPNSMAAVAQAEADHAEETTDRAWLLAWAGSYLERVSPEAAARLHREALDLDPTCAVALSALEREGADNMTMASVLISAARSAKDDRDQGLNLLRAAVRYMAAGAREEALEAMAMAREHLPGDLPVRRALVRLAMERAGEFDAGGLLEEDPAEDTPFWEALMIGSLGLQSDPARAAKWFEAAVNARPGDPFGAAALSRARLRGGRKSEESSRLLGILREAQTPEDEARVYVRLADVDARYGKDQASAALSLMSVKEKLPGHRTTLGRLAVYLAGRDRREDLSSVVAALGATLGDDVDGSFAAQEALRASPLDIELNRLAHARTPGSLYSAARLEAHTSDPGERIRCLEEMASTESPAIVHLSRLADGLEDDGQTERSLELRFRALESDSDSRVDLLGIERKMREIEDLQGLERTLSRLAEVTDLKQYKIERLLEASRVALEGLGDPGKAAAHCLEVLRLEPDNDEAFSRGRGILESKGDLVLLNRFLEARIDGIEDGEEKLALLDDIAGVRVEMGSREDAKAAVRRAIEIGGGDVRRHRWLAALHREDSEWSMAIEQLVDAARRTTDTSVGVEVFFELGVLYMDHGERPDLAEKSFVKVLGWDRAHFEAMERLSVLYEATGNWQRCIQALEHLVKMTDDLDTKVAKTVELARVLESGMGKPRDAESVLSQIRRTAPLDNRPVEFLASMYTRQKDAMALNVLLDQALTTNAVAVAERPGDRVILSNIQSILDMKAEDAVGSMAKTAISLLEGGEGAADEVRWNVGARIGDPALEGFLCPKQVPPGLRETLKAVGDPVARMLGISVKNMGLSKDSRLDRKHPLGAMISSMYTAFGIKGEPQVYTAEVREILIIPGSPYSVVVPAAAAKVTSEEILGYLTAYCLTVVRSGVALATLLDEQKLVRVIAAIVKVSVPGFEVQGLDPKAVEAESAALRQGMSSKLLAHIQPFSFDCGEALRTPRLKEMMLSIGLRAGFLGAGSFSGAIAGMTRSHGLERVPMDRLPGVGNLLSFVFGKDHLELRKRMGL